jgi:hypothetical protein
MLKHEDGQNFSSLDDAKANSGARSAALPHLRTFCRRAAPAERARSTVARGFRPPRVKDARLVGARAQPAHAVLRRSDEGSACHAARAHAERARRSLTRSVTALSLLHRSASATSGTSDVDFLRDLKSVIDLDTEISNRALDLGIVPPLDHRSRRE